VVEVLAMAESLTGLGKIAMEAHPAGMGIMSCPDDLHQLRLGAAENIKNGVVGAICEQRTEEEGREAIRRLNKRIATSPPISFRSHHLRRHLNGFITVANMNAQDCAEALQDLAIHIGEGPAIIKDATRRKKVLLAVLAALNMIRWSRYPSASEGALERLQEQQVDAHRLIISALADFKPQGFKDLKNHLVNHRLLFDTWLGPGRQRDTKTGESKHRELKSDEETTAHANKAQQLMVKASRRQWRRGRRQGSPARAPEQAGWATFGLQLQPRQPHGLAYLMGQCVKVDSHPRRRYALPP
jgi:hypothetical protein